MKVFICMSFQFGPVKNSWLENCASPVLYRQLIMGKKIGGPCKRCTEACELNVRLQSSRPYYLLIYEECTALRGTQYLVNYRFYVIFSQ